MQEIEAKEILEQLKLHVENGIYTQDMATTIRVHNEIDAYNLAINALEKQVPLKVHYPINESGKTNYKAPYCFKCGTHLHSVLYCPHCGQKIDWE